MPRLRLILPALLLAGCPGDDGTAESTQGEDGSGTTAGSATAADSSTGTTPATTDGDGTTTTSDTTPGDTTTGGGGSDPGPACVAGCEHLIKCGVADVPTCGIPCGGITGAVAGCEDEYIAQQECMTALSCDDTQAWSDGMMLGGGYPCSSEDVAFQMCIGGDTE